MKSNQEKEWLNVTPRKMSRSSPKSQKGLDFDQVSIPTRSRFTVLSPMGEQEENNSETEEMAEEENSTKTVKQAEESYEVMGEKVITRFDEKEQEGVQEDEVIQPEEERQEMMQDNEANHRRILPRESKVNHRYLRDKPSQRAQEDPSNLNKKKPRRH